MSVSHPVKDPNIIKPRRCSASSQAWWRNERWQLSASHSGAAERVSVVTHSEQSHRAARELPTVFILLYQVCTEVTFDHGAGLLLIKVLF